MEANSTVILPFFCPRSTFTRVSKRSDNRVAVTVAHEPHLPQDIKAVYAGCLASEVTDLAEQSLAWKLLAERHPNLMDLAPHLKHEAATMVAECRHVSVLDYSQGLGHTESLTVELPERGPD